jgi:hypothetical protein
LSTLPAVEHGCWLGAQLYGVCFHRGTSARCGHYVTFARLAGAPHTPHHTTHHTTPHVVVRHPSLAEMLASHSERRYSVGTDDGAGKEVWVELNDSRVIVAGPSGPFDYEKTPGLPPTGTVPYPLWTDPRHRLWEGGAALVQAARRQRCARGPRLRRLVPDVARFQKRWGQKRSYCLIHTPRGT